MTVAAPPVVLRRLDRTHLVLLDAVLAAGLAVLCWYAASEAPAPPATGWHEPAWVTVLTGAALGLPVVLRRLWPVTVTVALTVVATAALVTGIIPDFAVAAPLTAVGTALYSVGTTVAGRRSCAVLAGCVTVTAGALLVAADSRFGPGAAEVAFAVLVLGASWAVGWALRERRTHAVRVAAEATESAVRDERLRIAREMHDIIAHSMSLIAVKATIADHVADDRPEEVRAALRVIASTSRTALADLRTVLGAVRAEAQFAPAPGLDDLPSLVAQAQSAGLHVDLEVRVDRPVPDGLALSVFRTVQESLTNVVKHADARRCTVEVVADPGEVRVLVTDDGRAGAAPGTGGHGLAGMRERVALFGGDLAAGPDGTGWSVRARLPYGVTP